MRTPIREVQGSHRPRRIASDRIITYALAASIAAHLLAIAVVGRTSASRLGSAPSAAIPRYVKVDLIDYRPKPKPAPVAPPPPEARPEQEQTAPPQHQVAPAEQPVVGQPTPAPQARPGMRAPAPARVAGNPGGKLNIGSTSTGGDLPGNWGGGRTRTGWVPGNDNGRGEGSGSGAGVGTPEPPKHADDGPGTRPAPAPAIVTVNVRVCEESGMLPGDNCRHTKSDSFVEGRQPGRTCNQCQPEHKSRLADRKEPHRKSKVDPQIPGSVEEGLTFQMEIEYYSETDGSVSGVRVTRSSGNSAVDRAVTRDALKWRYDPATQDGVPQRVKVVQPVTVKS